MMKNWIKRFMAFALVLMLVLPSATAFADTGYTYNYDFWETLQYSPDAYCVKTTLTYLELGLDKRISNAEGMFVKGNHIYICDTGNNRILDIVQENHTYKVERIITEFTGDTEVLSLNGPTDIYVNDLGHMFICDKGNNRVLKLTDNLEYVMSFLQPEDELFDQSISFLPNKLVVDGAERVYLVANHVNKGLIKYENDGTFSGFVGSTPVTYKWYDYIWKNYLMTKAQRDQTQDFTPTEYDNIAIDADGFMYVCTTHFDEADLRNDQAMPVRRLNSLGNDILIKNGEFPPIGDVEWSDDAGYTGSSKFVDVTALDNDTYFCLDRTRGRIFGYNSQGQLLYAFGGNGNKDGYFRKPVALEHMGTDLLVLDSQDGQITVFTPTDFGRLIFEALDLYRIGLYEDSADIWEKVLALDGNYELAYIGIGRSLLRQNRYQEAMKYFKTKMDDDNYAKAFKLYRKEWVENHIGIIFIVFFAIVLIPLIIGRIKKLKWEVAEYEKEARIRK